MGTVKELIGQVRDGLVRDGLVRDGLVRDGLVRDGLVRDGLVRDGLVRDGLVPVEEVAPEIARLVAAATARNAAEVEGLSRVDVINMRMAGVLAEVDDTDTFVEVEAAA